MALQHDVQPQIPLVDEGAEEALIGAMMVNAEARAIGISKCSIDDFSLAEHQAIFIAIDNLMTISRRVDTVTILSELPSVGIVPNGGVEWADLLANIQINAGWSTKNVDSYVDIVLSKSRARRARAASLEFQQKLSEGVDPQVAISGMFEALNEGQKDDLVSMGDLVDSAINLYEYGRPKNGTSTGLPDLDAILNGGFLPHQFIVVGARPGMGKTAFGLGLAVHAAKTLKVLFVSAEMGKDEIAARMISLLGGPSSSQFMNADGPDSFSAGEVTSIMDAISKMAQLQLSLIEGSPSVSAIRARVQTEAMTGEPFGLVVIDYLQLLTPDSHRGGSQNRQNDVSEMSRGLKVLAMNCDLTVIALSQLSRSLESRSDKRPMLSDLRDSGAIEADADDVLFLYRDEVYDPASPDHGIAEINVAKQRNGPTGTARTAFIAERAMFAPLARSFGSAEVKHDTPPRMSRDEYERRQAESF